MGARFAAVGPAIEHIERSERIGFAHWPAHSRQADHYSKSQLEFRNGQNGRNSRPTELLFVPSSCIDTMLNSSKTQARKHKLEKKKARAVLIESGH